MYGKKRISDAVSKHLKLSSRALKRHGLDKGAIYPKRNKFLQQLHSGEKTLQPSTLRRSAHSVNVKGYLTKGGKKVKSYKRS